MLIKPHEYHKDVSSINWQKLYNQGKRVAVFDIDNTLDLPDKETIVSPELKAYINKVETIGFEVYFMSNNHEDRVVSFTRNFCNKYSYDANKPFQKSYKTLLKDVDNKTVVFVGDKIVTDVIGGNLFKGYTILVDPLTKKKKYWYTKFMNSVEVAFMWMTGFKKGRYYE